MHIRVVHHGVGSDVAVTGLSADATVADVLEQVAPQATSVVIDGVDIDFELRAVDCIRDGSTLDVDAQRPLESSEIVALLHGVAGPSAGRVWQLRRGTYSVGSDRAIDLPGITGTLTVSKGGTVRWDGRRMPQGLLAAGPHRLRVGPVPADGTNHPPGARSFFNRPPRQVAPAIEHPIDVPVRATVSGKPRRLSPLMIVLPAVTGVGMAIIFGRLMFLAFALLGPITMIGSAIDDRRRRRREQRESDEDFVAELEGFEQRVADACSAERDRQVATNPSVSELLMLGATRSQRLWERRPDHSDAFRVTVGYGSVAWRPPLRGDGTTDVAVAAAIAAGSVISDAPVTTTLCAGRVLGIAEDRTWARAVAADLICQLATLHGPSDLRVAVVTDDARMWDWTKWLPHTMSNQLSGLRLLGSTDDEINAITSALRSPATDDDEPLVLLVVDHANLDDEQQRIIRECHSGLGRHCAGVAIVDRTDQLPANCSEVVELGSAPRFRRPHVGLTIQGFTPRHTTPGIARVLAQSLAPLDDPESAVAGAGLPDRVTLLDALGLDAPTAQTVVARWTGGGRKPSLAVPVGTGEAGPYIVDLIKDGPHALMAGTTGSGKSEFLRTVVAALAATVSPDYLTFVLVDYKGGAAFDACADLPHVVGIVTDLDEHLGRRALHSLEAELHHREERLRQVGVSDIDEYWARPATTALPRLAVIVDEFATLAKELPDFMDALVDIAQRGRSLGVHMILATQRPSGVIKEPIRANTNLRISLRVQTVSDSKDVLNSPEAAAIPRSRPGRGYARLGPGELVPFQTALSTVASTHTGPHATVSPFVFGMSQPEPRRPIVTNGVTDLERLVAAITEAHGDAPLPRRPWQPDLPTELGWSELERRPESLVAGLGIVDQPQRQAQTTWTWAPHDDGNLLLLGTAGWGPTDGLLAAGIGLAASADPDEVHIYGIDHGAGRLGQLQSLPHVASIVSGDDVERQRRLLRRIRSEINERKAGTSGATIVLLIDGIAGFKATFDDPDLVGYRDLLGEIAASGPPQGVFVAVAADQNRTVPSALSGSLPCRLVFSLADRLEYGMLGVRALATELPRRRAIDPETQEHVHIAQVSVDDIRAIAADTSITTRTPDPIETLPSVVRVGEIVDAGSITDDKTTLPLGIDDEALAAACIEFYPGEHLLLAGPPRSGRSTVLTALGQVVRKLTPHHRLVAVAPRQSGVHLSTSFDAIGRTLSEVGPFGDPTTTTWLFVDDAEDVDDDGTLTELIERRAAHLRVIAAGRTDALRAHHRHWTKTVRAGRRGIVLRPLDPSDGDVLGARLPRGRLLSEPGRGYLIDGGVGRLIQTVSV